MLLLINGAVLVLVGAVPVTLELLSYWAGAGGSKDRSSTARLTSWDGWRRTVLPRAAKGGEHVETVKRHAVIACFVLAYVLTWWMFPLLPSSPLLGLFGRAGRI